MSEITIRRAVHTDIPFLIESNQAMATETEDLGLNIQALGKGIAYLMTPRRRGFLFNCRTEPHIHRHTYGDLRVE